MDLFWPECAPEAGRASLSVALSSLRNQLEPPGTPANAVLRADRFSISLNPQAVLTDVADFEAALQAAARAASATERVQQWEQAVALYHGRLLSGLYDAWIVPEEERLAGLFFDAVSALIGHLEEAGRTAEALRCARQAVSVDPLREEAHGHLIRLLAATGQPGAALRQYRELERRLDESLQTRPSAALRALVEKIEQEAGAASEPAAPARERAEMVPQAQRAADPPGRTRAAGDADLPADRPGRIYTIVGPERGSVSERPGGPPRRAARGFCPARWAGAFRDG
jgi:DNA-binding SARP family transcriptional activator